MTVRPVLIPERFIPEKQPEIVWVVTPDREVLRLARPRVEGDTLRGAVVPTGELIALPLRGGLEIRARQVHGPRTGLLIAAFGALAGVVVYGFTHQGTPETKTFCTIDEGHNTFCLP